MRPFAVIAANPSIRARNVTSPSTVGKILPVLRGPLQVLQAQYGHLTNRTAVQQEEKVVQPESRPAVHPVVMPQREKKKFL